MRATVLGERQLDYVQAAQLRGERGPYIMFVEILPNIMGPIVVEATVRLGYAIFADRRAHVPRLRRAAALARLVAADHDNYTLLSSGTYWWTVLFACAAIATLVIGVNLVADGLQQVVDE